MLLLLLIFPLCSAYMNNWFPIVSKSSADFTHPNQIRILGKDFVLWKKDDAIFFTAFLIHGAAFKKNK